MAVRQYIGARYTTKVYENSLDASSAEWESGVTYEPLTMVTYNNSSYLSKKDVPGSVGDPASNPLYWVVTGAYNGQILNLQNQIDMLKSKYYDIRNYGMEDGDNIYDKLYDLLHDVVNPAGGGVVYFPAGTYYLDYTIVIPANTTFVGDGDITRIIFDNSDTYIGVGFITGGPNITIMNMDVEQASNANYDVVGDLPGAIGVSDYDYDAYTSKREHAAHRRAGVSNIKIINVNCHNCNYGIQVETGTNLISDIFIENHICESGMFSISPLVQNPIITNVYVNNIVCDTLRISTGYRGTRNVHINGLYCTQINVKSEDVHIDGFYLHSSPGNRTASSSGYDTAMVLARDKIFVANGFIDRSADSLQTRIIDGYTTTDNRRIFLNNIEVDDPSLFTLGYQAADYTSFYYSNINFNPYKGYSTTTLASTTASNVPPTIVYNGTPGQSKVSGCYNITLDSNHTVVIGTINSHLFNTDVCRKASGIGILFNRSDSTVPAEPCGIVIDPTTGEIKVYRVTVSGATLNTVMFEIVF